MTTERFVSHNKFGVGRIVGDDAGYVHVLFIDIYEKKKFQKSCEQIVPVPHSLEDFQKLRARQHRWRDEYPVHENSNDMMNRGVRLHGCYEQGKRR